jgi:hypothetical protein
MYKSALLFAVVMAATAPTAAMAKAKMSKPRVVSTTPANQNALSAKLVADGISQVFVPLQVTLAQLNAR